MYTLKVNWSRRSYGIRDLLYNKLQSVAGGEGQCLDYPLDRDPCISHRQATFAYVTITAKCTETLQDLL